MDSLLSLLLGAVGGAVATFTRGWVGAFWSGRVTGRRLELELRAEEQRKLRKLIARYHGRMLEAALDWNRRMWQLYENPDGQYLDIDDRLIDDRLTPDGDLKPKFVEQYLFRSYVYRFLALCAIARRFETEAFYIESQIARENDRAFVKFAKSFLWVMTSPDLHKPFDDGMPGRDHFRNDEFRPILDACYQSRPAPLADHEPAEPDIFDMTRFDEMLRQRDSTKRGLDEVLRFFDGLKKDDTAGVDDGKGGYQSVDRYRWDRLVALHLLVMAFIDAIGYPWQKPTEDQYRKACAHFRHQEIRRNFVEEFRDLGLADHPTMQELGTVLRRPEGPFKAVAQAAPSYASRSGLDSLRT
jgi:hypothetical protein